MTKDQIIALLPQPPSREPVLEFLAQHHLAQACEGLERDLASLAQIQLEHERSLDEINGERATRQQITTDQYVATIVERGEHTQITLDLSPLLEKYGPGARIHHGRIMTRSLPEDFAGNG